MSMQIRLVKTSWDTLESDVLILPLFQDESLEEGLAAEVNRKLNGLLAELRDTEECQGKPGEVTAIYRPPQLKVDRLILVGVGKREEFDTASIRNFSMQAVRQVKTSTLAKVAFFRRSAIDASLAAEAAVQGIILATYQGDDYKTQEKSRDLIEEIIFATDEDVDTAQVEAAIRRGEILARSTNLARRLANQPGNRINPALLAEEARQVAEKYGLEIEVWGEPEMQKKEMNAILAVARGSDEPARFIVLKHLGDPRSDARPIVFIGKGVTFDSGGLSLKPAQSMEEMKSDKAGACAVLGAMQAVAELQVKKNVIGLIPAVENLPSGRAQRPGDVIRSMSGKTIEVINTDAEGRLILADALHYARSFDPQCIIDIATLTGACIVALGHVRAGLFCNNEALYNHLLKAAHRAGEKLWRLPLDDEYRREIKSDIADMKNVGSRWGGAITAAKFLQEFVGDTPWCHIDMAGVDLFKEGQEGKGPTGFGVRTLAQFAAD